MLKSPISVINLFSFLGLLYEKSHALIFILILLIELLPIHITCRCFSTTLVQRFTKATTSNMDQVEYNFLQGIELLHFTGTNLDMMLTKKLSLAFAV